MAYIDIIPLADAKVYLRIDDTLTEDDAQITRMISAALSYVENYTNHILVSADKTYRMVNGFVRVYDYPINSVVSPLANVYATGTAQCTSCIATDTLTVNGNEYTGVTGTPADFTEFSVDTSDTVTAASLARAINGDTRLGTLGDVSATSTGDTVTITTNKKGFAGNATTLAQTGGTITVSGATFTGGLDGDLDVDKATLYTSYCSGSINKDLILNVGYDTVSDIPQALVEVAYEIIDSLYYEKETNKSVGLKVSAISQMMLDQYKRYIL